MWSSWCHSLYAWCSAGSVISVNEKNPTLTLSLTCGPWSRTAIVTRDVAQSVAVVVAHLDVPHPASCGRGGSRRAVARARCPRSPAAGSSCCSTCRAAPCPAGARRRAVPIDASVSAIAAYTPPCTMPIGWHTRGIDRQARRCSARPRPSSSTTKPIVASNASLDAATARARYGTSGHAARCDASVVWRRWAPGTWESHHAITTLMFRYAECIDAADFDGIAELFADAVHHQRGRRRRDRGRRRDRAALPQHQPRARRRHAAHPPPHDERRSSTSTRTRGTATARSAFVVFQQTPTLPLQPIVTGRYRDRFARVDGELALRSAPHRRRPRRRRPRAPRVRPRRVPSTSTAT